MNLSPDNHEAEIVLDKRSEKFASFDCTFNFFSRMKKSVPKCLRTLQCSFNLCGKLTFIKVYFICCIRGCALIKRQYKEYMWPAKITKNQNMA